MHIAFLIKGAYQCKGTGLRVCVLHVHGAPGALCFQRHSSKIRVVDKMSRLSACDCVQGRKRVNEAVFPEKNMSW